MKEMWVHRRRIPAWLWDHLRWAARPRKVWVWLSVTTLASVVAYAPPFDIAVGPDWAGLGLQLLGVACVVVELHGRSRLFGLDWRERLRGFFVKRPRLAPKVASGGGNSAVTVSATGGGYAWYNDDPTAPLDERFSVVFKNLEVLRRELRDRVEDLSKSVRDFDQKQRREFENRDETLAKMGQRLERLGTGSLDLELLGIAWLISGLVLSSLGG